MHADLPQAEGLVHQALEPIVASALQRFRALLPAEVELATDLVRDPPGIHAHGPRLEQALLSAFIVAWHSMLGQATRIVVELSDILLDDVVLDPDAAQLQGGLPPRRYVRLLVSNSSRMEAGPFHQLVPPPATTDDRAASAHRLPLVEVNNIIAQHQGLITVSQEPGRGTAFDIYLPAALPREADGTDGGGTARKNVMYVDDYEAMRALVAETLPDAGFTVVCHADGRQALSALLTNPASVDALVTDYRLVGHTGLDLLKRVKKIRPELPVIILSGYINQALQVSAQEAGAALVISKDRDLSELCVALHRLLGHAPRPALSAYSEWGKL